MEPEIWKDVHGYEGLYQVSNWGRVRRWSVSILKGQKRLGYHRVSLCRKQKHRHFFVHGLVMRAFVGERPPNHQVNHKNAIRDDNRVENLEYVTPAYNQWYTNHIAHTRESQKGSAHGRSKITEQKAIAIRKARDSGESLSSIAQRFKVCIATVSLIASGKIWKHVVPNEPSRKRFRVNKS